jgi:predicted HNH restriction endonuclease
MDVHHKKHYSLFKNKNSANRLSNLVTLCRSCHAKAHSKRKKMS